MGRGVLSWVGLGLSVAGCAASIVSRGELRPDLFADVVARTERARGIAAPDEIDARVVTAAQMADVVEQTIREAWPPEEAAVYQETLVALGMWPRDREILDEYTRVVGGEAAGIYVPQHGVLYVVSDLEIPVSVRLVQAAARRDLMRELLVSHELVHLLQHVGYADVVELTTSLRDQDDVAVALQTALEGDAMRYSIAALETGQPPPSPVDLREQLFAEMDGGDLGEAPLVVRYGLVFPYAYGYGLSMLEGTLLLDDPPVSTEQVLHADRRREPFAVFDLAGLRERLPAGCRPLAENTLGEMGISVLFRDLVDRPRARAWEGWDGDRFLGARCSGSLEFVWLTAWDSAGDAAEFVDEYARIAAAVAERAGLVSAPRTERRAERVVVHSPGLRSLVAEIDASVSTRRVSSFAELPAFDFTPAR